MARTSTDPTTAIPEADLLDQQHPAAPDSLSTTHVHPCTPESGTVLADEADLLDQLTPLPEDDSQDYPTVHSDAGGGPMPDSLAEITRRLHREFPTVALSEVIELVRRCRADIDTGAPEDSIPELVERLARARLTDAGESTYRMHNPRPGTAVVELLGEHDLDTMSTLQPHLDAIAASNQLLVVDISQTRFIDAAVANTLTRLDSAMARRGGRLRLQLDTFPNVERVLAITGLLTHLEIVRSRAEALQALPQPAQEQ